MSLFGLSFWQQCLPAILFLLLCAGAAAVAHRPGPAVARLARSWATRTLPLRPRPF
ncbi:MAG: hypothetical protein ACLRPX_07325 [Ruthenibacterium sp.]